MSEDLLSQLFAQILARNLRPLVIGLWSLVVSVVVAVATGVGMWSDMKHAVADAERIAVEAKESAAEGRLEIRTLATGVATHSMEIAVLKAHLRQHADKP